MKKGTVIISAAITAVIIGLIAVSAVIGVKFRKEAKTAEETPVGYKNSIDYGTITEEEPATLPDFTEENTFADDTSTATTSAPAATVTAPKVFTTKIITAAQKKITKAVTTVKETVKADNGSTAQVVVEEGVTVPVLEDAEHGKAATVDTTVADAELPKDMYFSGLYSMGYDVIGPKEFIYNDDTDPKCMQKNFGYNVLYDAGAKLIDFSIETTRIKFDYGDKSYMLQLWKGQYISGDIGTVGGEVGLYTRAKNSVSAIGHYDCAAQEDWLNMEMTVLWDEDDNGVYKAQLTRRYAPHWWETGYVDGQLKDRNDSNSLKILCRMTFLTQEQATLCVNAMIKNGFKKVSSFDPTGSDLVKQYGKDVIYVWHKVR